MDVDLVPRLKRIVRPPAVLLLWLPREVCHNFGVVPTVDSCKIVLQTTASPTLVRLSSICTLERQQKCWANQDSQILLIARLRYLSVGESVETGEVRLQVRRRNIGTASSRACGTNYNHEASVGTEGEGKRNDEWRWPFAAAVNKDSGSLF